MKTKIPAKILNYKIKIALLKDHKKYQKTQNRNMIKIKYKQIFKFQNSNKV